MKEYNDIVAMRKYIFKQCEDIRKGKVSIEKGILMHKMFSDIMEGYRIQTKVFELSSLKSPMTIEDSTKLLK